MSSCWGSALRRGETLERYYLRHLVEPVPLEELLVDILARRKDSPERRAAITTIVEDFTRGNT